MQRIVILGGGVGGTLAANLLARKLKGEIRRGEATVTVVDDTGEHTYQPGFMYIAMGNQKPERLKRPERSLLDDEVELVVGRAVEIDPAARRVVLDHGQ
jgi:sulfide:quinone oxidoreductase